MRIAIIGDGSIGQGSAARLLDRPPGMELCAVYSRSGRAAATISTRFLVPDIDTLLAARPQLVVEAADASVSRSHGERILAVSDYLPLSLSALVDDSLLQRLQAAATSSGTHLWIPHGAVVGMESLFEWREQWAQVGITFRKNPRNIDFSASGLAVADHSTESLVFSGSVRVIARRFPRNVNAMVACALATTGLDRCEARLFSDPQLDKAVLEIEARGQDGSRIEIRREQPVEGVSGSEMSASIWRSITLVCRQRATLDFV